MHPHLFQKNLLVVLDTAALAAACPHPSLLPSKPTPLPNGTAWLIQSGGGSSSAIPVTKGLILNTRLPSHVALRATTVEANSATAVNVAIRPSVNEPALAKPSYQLKVVTLQDAVQPDPSSLDGLPALQVHQSFSNLSATLHGIRPVTLPSILAVYLLDNSGQTQTLWGYFSLDLRIKPVILPEVGVSE